MKYYIYGAGGHAMVVAEAASKNGIPISGFIDDFSYEEGRSFCGNRVYGPAVLKAYDAVFLGFGNNRIRQKTGERLLEQKIQLPVLIHPRAVVASDIQFGQGVFVAAGAIIDPECRIGNFCIINNGACICHETVLEDAVHICPGSICAGKVHVSERVWVGLGSRIIEKISIAPDVFIGAGTVIVSNIETPASLVYGVPGKVHVRQ